jgi:hypothetical protein
LSYPVRVTSAAVFVGSAGGFGGRTARAAPTGCGCLPAAESNRACGSLAHGSPTSFSGWQTQSWVSPFRSAPSEGAPSSFASDMIDTKGATAFTGGESRCLPLLWSRWSPCTRSRYAVRCVLPCADLIKRHVGGAYGGHASDDCLRVRLVWRDVACPALLRILYLPSSVSLGFNSRSRRGHRLEATATRDAPKCARFSGLIGRARPGCKPAKPVPFQDIRAPTRRRRASPSRRAAPH